MAVNWKKPVYSRHPDFRVIEVETETQYLVETSDKTRVWCNYTPYPSAETLIEGVVIDQKCVPLRVLLESKTTKIRTWFKLKETSDEVDYYVPYHVSSSTNIHFSNKSWRKWF